MRMGDSMGPSIIAERLVHYAAVSGDAHGCGTSEKSAIDLAANGVSLVRWRH